MANENLQKTAPKTNNAFVDYFELTWRIEENCLKVSEEKKKLESTNNHVWKALFEFKNIIEILSGSTSGLTCEKLEAIKSRALVSLDEVNEKHRSLIGESIAKLQQTSTSIFEDLDAAKKMLLQRESFEFRKEFENVANLVQDEFDKPSIELEEAEELQELLASYNLELEKAA